MMELKYVKRWFACFILLAISFVLFLCCFWLKNIAYYAVCFSVFTAFCICYTRCDKTITCKEGYTLVQAILFYKKCEKIILDNKKSTKKNVSIVEIAHSTDYTRNFDQKTILSMYRKGKQLVDEYNKEKRRK